MVRKVKDGDRVNGYKVTKLLNVGALAIAYAAESAAGEKVFFKQYKSPSITVEWYKGYVAYQQALKQRIESGVAVRFTYRFIDFFEAVHGHKCYFQVFEFVEDGHDLDQILDKIRENPGSFTWEQRLIYAKVIMAAVNALHASGVIHCDLKPANIQLFPDDTIEAGFVVKLIDMDYSILNDKQAPWHGIQGYVGSPRFFSPEHLTPGAAPVAASDVFTCGLILHELLTAGHPYQIDEPGDYYKAVMAYGASRPKLIGTMPAPATNADVEEALHRCLAPEAASRPSALDILKILNGQMKANELRDRIAPHSKPPGPIDRDRAEPEEADTTRSDRRSDEPAPLAESQVVLTNAAGVSLPPVGITTPLGVYVLKPLGEDAKYFDKHQCTLKRDETGNWSVVHNHAAKHQTLINGKQVAESMIVKHGDVLAVGSEERAIQKLPLTIRMQ